MAEINDAVAAFLTGDPTKGGDIAELQQGAPDVRPGSTGIVEDFSRGVSQGAQQIGSDIEYFKALGNTLMGDQEDAATAIRKAEVHEAMGAEAVEGMETFGEFLDQPTVGGFFTQVAKGTGQLFPSAISSVAGFGTGAVVGVVGKGALSFGGKAAAKKMITEALEKKAKGLATPEEEAVAQLAYEGFRKEASDFTQKTVKKRAIKHGAYLGGAASEYVPMAGSNFGEALEAGQTAEESALRSALVAVPQAGIGAFSEAALVRALGKLAEAKPITYRGVKQVLKEGAKGFGQQAPVEGATEVLQEGLGAALRHSYDPEYTLQDTQMRLAESAFMGFFGGGVAGGVGGVTVSAAQEAMVAAARTDTAGKILDQAAEMVSEGQDAEFNINAAQELVDSDNPAMTNVEPVADINAQIEAVNDPQNPREAVWISDEDAELGANPDGTITKTEYGYTVFIEGRGTLYTRDKALAEEVAKNGADDTSLAVALGYSQKKPADANQAVQVTDKDGNVVFEEATNDTGLQAAQDNAQKYIPEGGKLTVLGIEEALVSRDNRAKQERFNGRDVRSMDDMFDDADDLDGMDYSNATYQDDFSDFDEYDDGSIVDQENSDPLDSFLNEESDAPSYGTSVETKDGVSMGEQSSIPLLNPSNSETGTYKGRKPGTKYDDHAQLEKARVAFEQEFPELGAIDWDGFGYETMSKAVLQRIVAEQQEYKGEGEVTWTMNTDDGSWTLGLEMNEGVKLYRHVNKAKGTETKLPLKAFLRAEIAMAARSKYAGLSKVVMIDPNGKESRVNLYVLIGTGRRLLEAESGQFATADLATALKAIMSELVANDFKMVLDTELDGSIDMIADLDAVIHLATLAKAFKRDEVLLTNRALSEHKRTLHAQSQEIQGGVEAALLRATGQGEPLTPQQIGQINALDKKVKEIETLQDLLKNKKRKPKQQRYLERLKNRTPEQQAKLDGLKSRTPKQQAYFDKLWNKYGNVQELQDLRKSNPALRLTEEQRALANLQVGHADYYDKKTKRKNRATYTIASVLAPIGKHRGLPKIETYTGEDTIPITIVRAVDEKGRVISEVYWDGTPGFIDGFELEAKNQGLRLTYSDEQNYTDNGEANSNINLEKAAKGPTRAEIVQDEIETAQDNKDEYVAKRDGEQKGPQPVGTLTVEDVNGGQVAVVEEAFNEKQSGFVVKKVEEILSTETNQEQNTPKHTAVSYGPMPYEYSMGGGRTARHTAKPIPAWMGKLMRNAERQLGHPEGYFNHVLINRYDDGQGIGAHFDAELIYSDENGKVGAVGIYSIGNTSTKHNIGGVDFTLPHNSLAEMSTGSLRHSVGKSKGTRYSINFRHIPDNQLATADTATETGGVGENISSKGSSLAKKLTNPGNNLEVEYKGKTFRNAEHAYQTWKSGKFDQKAYDSTAYKPIGSKPANKKTSYQTMVEVITAKLEQHPELVQEIENAGGNQYLNNSTHEVTGDKFWEGSQGGFMKALREAFNNQQTTETKTETKTETNTETESKTPLSPKQVKIARERGNRKADNTDKAILVGKQEEQKPSSYTMKKTSSGYTYEGEYSGRIIEDPDDQFGKGLDDLPLSRLNIEAEKMYDPHAKNTKAGPARRATTPSGKSRADSVERGTNSNKSVPVPFLGPVKASHRTNKNLNTSGGKSTTRSTGQRTTAPKLSRTETSGKGRKQRPHWLTGSSINPIMKTGLNKLVAVLNLRSPIVIMDTQGIMKRAERGETIYEGDEEVGAALIRLAQELDANPNGMGRYVPFGDTHVVLLNSKVSNPMAAGLAVAHEIGHALYREEHAALLQNKPLYTRMQKAFEKARAADDAPSQYQGEHGFEEWYADQVASWVKKDIEKVNPRNMTDSYFRKVARILKRAYRVMNAQLKKRFGDVTPSFQEYMKGVLESDRRANQDTSTGTRLRWDLAVDAEQVVDVLEGVRNMDNDAAPVVEPAKTSSMEGGAAARQKLTNAAKNLFKPFLESEALQSIYTKLAKVLTTADGQMRALGAKSKDKGQKVAGQIIADMMYARAGHEGIGPNNSDSKYGDGEFRGSNMGYLRERSKQMKLFQNKVGKIMAVFDAPKNETDIAKKEREAARLAAYGEAMSSKPTRELIGPARELREFLENDVYANYIAKSRTDMGRQDNYAPVVLDLAAIDQNPQAFVDLIWEVQEARENAEHAKNKERGKARSEKEQAAYLERKKKDIMGAVEKLQRLQQPVDENAEIVIDRGNPNAKQNHDQERILTKDIDRTVLQDAGFLQAPDLAFVSYLKHLTKRVEWDRVTLSDKKGADGRRTNLLQEQLDKLKSKDRARAEELLNTYLGYGMTIRDERLRKANAIVGTFQFWTTLGMAAIGSFPEMAGPIFRSRELNALPSAFKELFSTVRTYADSMELAEDIAVVSRDSFEDTWASASEQDFLAQKINIPFTKKSIDLGEANTAFFKYTGLQMFTNFTRMFAANMGVRFIEKHALKAGSDVDSEFYMKELGITAEDVKAWQDNGKKFDTPEGEKVRDALHKFVESSTLRPNAAERPPWASDPKFMLLWQLKSFFYSYGKVIIAQMINTPMSMANFKARKGEKSGADATIISANRNADYAQYMSKLAMLMVFAAVPFAMLSLHLREVAKELFKQAGSVVGISEGKGSKAFTTPEMSIEYLWRLKDVSGQTGFGMVFNTLFRPPFHMENTQRIAELAGPTSGMAYQMINSIGNDFVSMKTAERFTPFNII